VQRYSILPPFALCFNRRAHLHRSNVLFPSLCRPLLWFFSRIFFFQPQRSIVTRWRCSGSDILTSYLLPGLFYTFSPSLCKLGVDSDPNQKDLRPILVSFGPPLFFLNFLLAGFLHRSPLWAPVIVQSIFFSVFPICRRRLLPVETFTFPFSPRAAFSGLGTRVRPPEPIFSLVLYQIPFPQRDFRERGSRCFRFDVVLTSVGPPSSPQ